MTHRIFRLAIAPSAGGATQHVIEFDGRTSLEQVQLFIRETFGLELRDPRYAFLLAGAIPGEPTRYVDPRMVGARADKALLFRLGLRVGDRLEYVCDFGVERRYSVVVLAIITADVALSRPRPVHGAAAEGSAVTSPADTEPLATLASSIATRVVALRALRGARGTSSNSDELNQLRELGSLALELGMGLGKDLTRLIAIERAVKHPTLTLDLLSLPLELGRASQTELALQVARAFEFAAQDEMRGSVALIHALAGARDEAVAAVQENLAVANHRYVAEAKAGDVYRALGEPDSAEVYYRRSLAEARTASERSEATLRLTSFLLDNGREQAAADLVRAVAASEPSP